MTALGLVLGSGAAGLIEGEGDFAVVNRHGDAGYALPHEIDHAANMRALVEAGCDRVLAISSVGSLRADLPPGSLVCPADFIALDLPPLTTLRGFDAHRSPGFDAAWRRRVTEVLGGRLTAASAVYWQVRGPRLETRAEVRFVAAHADVIGMTVGSECVVAGELGLRYAALCMVDNYATGVTGAELTADDVRAAQLEHRDAIARGLAQALPELAASFRVDAPS